MVFADTHCHLYFETFHPDLTEVLDRARENGVDRILIPGIDLETSQQAIELAEKYTGLFAAAGTHPNDGSSWNDDSVRMFRSILKHPKVVAVGEIGLDYYRDRTPREAQKKIFREQLELAAEMNLPVIIHNRQAGSDLLAILHEWHMGLVRSKSLLARHPGVLHSFDGNLAQAEQAAADSFYIGISGPLTYRNALEKQEVVTNLPLERLLLETDAPYLTPHPHRGKRNEPGYIPLIADKVAQLQEIPVEEVSRVTSNNAQLLFHWRDIA